MFPRPFWEARIRAAWQRRSVVWLMGVRRVGKTVLCQSLPGVEYFDCERPRTRQILEDPESFLDERRGRDIVLDEIHRLPNPAELLKIAADHYRDIRIVATGSSTLGASARFRDTLAGRKQEVWLTPMVLPDLQQIPDLGPLNRAGLRRRIVRGGLPPFLLSEASPNNDFQEWLDAYWAKDVLELFRLERRQSFQRLFELLLVQSGGIFEASSLARPVEASRPTVGNYLAVLEATFVMHVIRPYSAGGAAELTSAPKVYGFDTGFVCHYRGWDDPKPEELGILWEHLVLNELHAHVRREQIHYWRSKHGNEVDFVLARSRTSPVAIECKWSTNDFDPAGLKAFRRRYPKGLNLLVATDIDTPYVRRLEDLDVRYTHLTGLTDALSGSM